MQSDEATKAERTALPARAEVLVAAAEPLAAGLREGVPRRRFGWRNVVSEEQALEAIRERAPEIIVVDDTLPWAMPFVEKIFDDPALDAVPVFVVDSGTDPARTARYVALGATRVLTRDEVLTALGPCLTEVLDAQADRTERIVFGTPTVEELGDRLAIELKRALVGGVARTGRGVRVPIGDGAEIMGAMWGAIARVQAIVQDKSNDAVRFRDTGPEGAIAIAPLPSRRERRGGGGDASRVRLDGRRVLVADDDPSVTWFIADALRAEGCIVDEALDGRAALDLALRTNPQVVVSDILMPGMNGIALCRALKRDVALHDVPVILLYWKEDLLQFVREQAANASAYVRKTSQADVIVTRVRAALATRAAVEERMRGGDAVRGRLAGLGARTLLELVCTLRPNSMLTVREPGGVHEVMIRNGSPVRASCRVGDRVEKGELALAMLLGARQGEFEVMDTTAPVEAQLEGTLAHLLADPLAASRAVLEIVLGEDIDRIDRVVLRPMAFELALAAMPEAQACLVRVLAEGGTFTQLRGLAGADDVLVADVVADLAGRAAIQGLLDARGNDLLASTTPTDFAMPPVMTPALPLVTPAVTVLEPGDVELSTISPAPAHGPDAPRADAEGADTPRPTTTSAAPSRAPRAPSSFGQGRGRWHVAVALTAAGALFGAAFTSLVPKALRGAGAQPAAEVAPPPTVAVAPKPPRVQVTALSDSMQVPMGQGLLHINAPRAIRIGIDDGERLPLSTYEAPVRAGVHEIVIELPGEERVHFVEVLAGQATYVDVEDAP